MVQSPASKITHSVGFTVRAVTVQQVYTDPSTGLTWAVCADKQNMEIRVPAYTLRAKGQPPQAGETWLADQSLGFWSLAAYVGPPGAGSLLPPLDRPVIPELHAGAVTLASGNADVAFPAVTDVSVIILGYQTTSGTTGTLSIASRVPGTGFTAHSSSNTDNSLVGWMLTEPG